MTVDEFALLPDRKQIELLYSEGVFVGKRKHGDQDIVLYQLEGFYIEIYYREYRLFITEIICSTSVDILTPYLAQINVHELLNV